MEGPLLDNPQRVGKLLTNEFDGYQSARVGLYRVVYIVDVVVRVVGVVAIGHRSSIYSRPPQ